MSSDLFKYTVSLLKKLMLIIRRKSRFYMH